MLRSVVSRWLVNHCGHSLHLPIQNPALNGPGDVSGVTRSTSCT
jgi:hypothetical protein